jgi:hypothetical protein
MNGPPNTSQSQLLRGLSGVCAGLVVVHLTKSNRMSDSGQCLIHRLLFGTPGDQIVRSTSLIARTVERLSEESV